MADIYYIVQVAPLLLAILSWIAGPHTLVNDAVCNTHRIGLLILAVLGSAFGYCDWCLFLSLPGGEPGQSKYIMALADYAG